jgi:hypothetical protein
MLLFLEAKENCLSRNNFLRSYMKRKYRFKKCCDFLLFYEPLLISYIHNYEVIGLNLGEDIQPNNIDIVS